MEIQNNSRIILDGKKMQTRDELFMQFINGLHFPEYFGMNWNALDDCLQDLEWLNVTNLDICIINKNSILSCDNLEEREIFFDCIKIANEWWNENKEKKIKFIFLD